MIAAKKFHLDYTAAVDGKGTDTGKTSRGCYVKAGEWQSGTCKQ